MITASHYFNNEVHNLSLNEIPEVLQVKEGVLWIDLENPGAAGEGSILVALLQAHPCAIEDARMERDKAERMPKPEDFSEYLFVSLTPCNLQKNLQQTTKITF